MARFYRRTQAGHKAWDTQAASVPLEYRRVLGVVSDQSSLEDVCAKLGWSDPELGELLDELVKRGLLERVETDDTDLDFTA